MKKSIRNLMAIVSILGSSTILWAQTGKSPTPRPTNADTSSATSGGTSTAAGGSTGQSSSSNCTVANDGRGARAAAPSGSSTGAGTQTNNPDSATSARH